MPRVVVGVDTSRQSLEALRWAAQEARWRRATLEVLFAFESPEPVAAFPVIPRPDRTDRETLRAQYEEQLRAWLAESDVDLGGIEVVAAAVARKPGRALVERSSEADLVVVASRGRGGFGGLRLGSVSEQVTRHARCAVLVVRAGRA